LEFEARVASMDLEEAKDVDRLYLREEEEGWVGVFVAVASIAVVVVAGV
jgi:hypothetical protein